MPDLSLTHIHQAPREGGGEDRPPLLILCHGVGSNEQDLFTLAGQLDPSFVVLSARAPHTRFPGSYAWFEVTVVDGEFVIHRAMWEQSLELLVRFIGEATAAYEADPRRVYLAGFSQGAIMSLCVMLTEPQLLAGVVAMSGRLLPEVRPMARPAAELTGFPVMVTHGTHDPVIAVRYAEETREYLSQLPVELDFRLYPMGHEISGASLRDIDAWLRERLERPAR